MHLIKRDNQAFLSSCLYITRCDADKTADQNMHTTPGDGHRLCPVHF